MRAIFANSTQTLRNISPRFSIVKLFVTPVYYPEYRGLLVQLRVTSQLTLNLRLLKMHCD